LIEELSASRVEYLPNTLLLSRPLACTYTELEISMHIKTLILAALILLLITLQVRLWVGEGSIAQVVGLKREIEEQKKENEMLRARNDRLAAEVETLKNGNEAVEARARTDMGLIKKGETFFMVIDEKDEPESTDEEDKNNNK